jgi:hypothetical protein
MTFINFSPQAGRDGTHELRRQRFGLFQGGMANGLANHDQDRPIDLGAVRQDRKL